MGLSGAGDLLTNPVVQTVLVIAILGILAGLSFLAANSAAITSANAVIASMLSLAALIWLFRK